MIVAADTVGVLDEPRATDFDELRLRIAAVRILTPKIRGFELVAEAGGPLPGFTAGAHVDVEVILADGERARRSYSIAGPPNDQPNAYFFGVLREEDGTGGSAFMHERAEIGTILNATKPKNFFELVRGADHSVLIAGGIGITPVLAMAHALTAQERSMELHYAARSEAGMAFKETVEEVCGDSADLYFDGGDPKRGVDIRSVLGTHRIGRHVYVCGPRGMIEAVRNTADVLRWPQDHVHFEVFTPPEAKSGDQPIEITIRSSGQVLTVEPGTPILDALLAAGVDSDYDCRMGICGSCAVNVLEGEADHRDTVLTTSEQQEERLMCTCVSWASTPKLVVDH